MRPVSVVAARVRITIDKYHALSAGELMLHSDTAITTLDGYVEPRFHTCSF